MPKLDRLVRVVSGASEFRRPVLRRVTDGGWEDGRLVQVGGQTATLLTGWYTTNVFPSTSDDQRVRPTSAQDWLNRSRAGTLPGLYYPPHSATGDFPNPAAVLEAGGQVYLLNEQDEIDIVFNIGPADPVVSMPGNEVLRYGVQLITTSFQLVGGDFTIDENTRLHLGFGAETERVIPVEYSERIWANFNEQAESVGTFSIGEADTEVQIETAVITARFDRRREHAHRILDEVGHVWTVTDSRPSPDLRFIEYVCQRNIRLVG